MTTEAHFKLLTIITNSDLSDADKAALSTFTAKTSGTVASQLCSSLDQNREESLKLLSAFVQAQADESVSPDQALEQILSA